MKLVGFTCTFNEAEMIPYVMPYIERMGYDKLIVYDNESTDNTVELLKQYPFIEVRSYASDKVNNVRIRTKLMADSFTEVHKMIRENNNEVFWMTWTDFDEVIFPIHLYKDTLKEILNWEYPYYNVYEASIVNLFPPKDIKQKKILKYVKEGNFIHEMPGMRCKLWGHWCGHKTLLIKVNDFCSIMTFDGNHQCYLKPGTNTQIMKIPNGIHSFHLKYINRDNFTKKLKTDNYLNNKTTYKNLTDYKFNKIVDYSYNSSYPLEYYFAMSDMVLLKEHPYHVNGAYEF